MTTKEMLAIVDKMHDQPCLYGIGGTAWIALRGCVEKLSPKVSKRSDSGAYHICPNKDCRRLIERHLIKNNSSIELAGSEKF